MDAYYTTQWNKKRYRGERFVYHIMRYCPSGSRIRGKDRTTEEAPVEGRKPCKECTALAFVWLNLPTVERSSL